MAPEPLNPERKVWTAAELRRLLPEQRDAILQAAAALAEADYCHDKQLTAFEAFGRDDLHGDSANTEARGNLAN